MAVSYEYSIGSVRAREKSLLTRTDIEQLLACRDERELVTLLTDKGYGKGKTVEELLSSHSEELWKYLKTTAPDFDIFKPFLIQNDAHNFKVTVKGTMADRDYDALLLSPCTVEHSVMRKAVESRLMGMLPDWLSKFADKAYETLAHTGDARLSDAYIDRAVMLEILRLSEGSKSAFLRGYFRNLVFYCDVKTAIRRGQTKLHSHDREVVAHYVQNQAHATSHHHAYADEDQPCAVETTLLSFSHFFTFLSRGLQGL